MENLVLISVIALWTVVLLNLWLTLNAVNQNRRFVTLREELEEVRKKPELPLGEPAPDFIAKTLTGERRDLASYQGHETLFLFMSTSCPHCRKELPELQRLALQAQKIGNVQFVINLTATLVQTHEWLNTLLQEDHVTVTLPILLAKQHDMQHKYNPRGLTPYFCFLDEEQRVHARGPLGRSEWLQLKQRWEGAENHVQNSTLSRYA